MKTCVNCGNIENSNNATSCSRCGGVLSASGRPCNNCGTIVDDAMSYCPKCGAAMNMEAERADYLPHRPVVSRYDDMAGRRTMVEPKPYGTNKAMIALVVAVCIMLISCVSVVAYLLIEKKDDNKTTAVNTEVADDTEGGTSNGVDTNSISGGKVVPEPPKESTYAVYKSNISWYDAYLAADRMGGHLVYINDAAEFTKVCAMAEQKGVKVFWMGAFVDYPRTDWSGVPWMNGAPMTYTKWLPGEPSGEDKDKSPEKYLMAFYVKKYGDWYFNDAPNDASVHNGKLGYVVEFEP